MLYFQFSDFPVPLDVGKVPLPLTSEISYCVDLAEMAGDFLWDNLLGTL